MPFVHSETMRPASAVRPLARCHGTPSHPETPFLLRGPDEMFHRRIARKRRAREALGYGSGGAAKLAVLSMKLGIAGSRIRRCLSLAERDELRPEYLRALGIESAVREVDAWPYERVLAYVGAGAAEGAVAA